MILEALALGNTVKDSCLGAGVGYSTVREWATADPEFADALEKAQAQARQKMVAMSRQGRDSALKGTGRPR